MTALLWLVCVGAAIQPATDVARTLPSPLPGHPGNVFVQGETVALDVPTVAGTTGWRLTDFAQQTVKTGTGARAELGALAVGYYELAAVGGEQALARVSLAVVAPLRAPTPQDSPICLDEATAWFYRPTKAPEAPLNHAALAGVNWVRDRLTWGETEPSRGKFAEHTHYDDTAAQTNAAGLKGLQVFHNSPKWAGPDAKHMCPDLRDVYRYLEAMSRRWHGQVRAWEPWNEGDIDGFGGQTGLELACWQKAAYWAIRRGDPSALVCHNVFATWIEPIMFDARDNQSYLYCDRFNFHHYSGTDSYPSYYHWFRGVSGGRPLWVSEAGTHIRWTGDTKEKEPAWPELVTQARFVTQCFAASLAEGSEATFFFILGNYAEGNVQFGLMRRDLTPRPGYLALAAAGRLLAGARPVGKLNAGPLRLFAFQARPDGEERLVVVAWGQGGSAPWPAWTAGAVAYDHLGRPLATPAKVGADPVYLLLPPGTACPGLTPPPAPARFDTTAPSPLVLQPLPPQAKLRYERSAWQLDLGQPLAVPVYAYNFGDQPLTTTVAATSEPGVRVTPASAAVTLAPGERAELPFTLVSDPDAPRGGLLRVTFKAPTADSQSVAVLRVVVPRGQLAPAQALPVPRAGEPGAWQPLVSPGKLAVTAGEGGVVVDATMQAGDRWCYPILPVGPDDRPAGFDGLEFTLVPLAGQATWRVILDQANGSNYLLESGLRAPLALGQPVKVLVEFRDAAWGGWSKPDPGGKLALGNVVGLKIGGNTKDEHLRYALRDLRWVKLK